MPTTRKRPQDYTGREALRLAKERDEASARAAEISMATAAEAEAKRDEVIDLTKEPEPQDQVEVGAVEVVQATRRVTMNTTLEQTTYGHGNTRTLEEGVTYILPKDWADHLDRLGFVYH